MATVNEVIEFLDIVSSKGFLNPNTAGARKTACRKFFDILDDNERTVEYVRDNLDSVKARFSNLNKDVTGATVEAYGRRVALVLKDFTEWQQDRGGWERRVSTKRSARSSGDGKKKQKRASRNRKTSQARKDSQGKSNVGQEQPDSGVRTVKFPIRDDFDLEIKLPRDRLTVAELQKVAYFLLPYTRDWEPTNPPASVFPMVQGD